MHIIHFILFISEYILQSQHFNINEKHHISKPEDLKKNPHLQIMK